MKKWLARCGWVAVGVAGLYATAALAGVVAGGSLDPPGSPGSTMKTLEEIPGTWSRVLSDGGPDSCNTARFTCVMNGDAVRDNETGLVWDRNPITLLASWSGSMSSCGSAIAGGRGGWRLPTDAEMRSLLDPNATQQPLLPDNHPFNVFTAHGYVWTSTAVPQETDLAYAVDTDTLDRIPVAKSSLFKKWCVRGVQTDAPEDSQVAEIPPAWYRTLDTAGGCLSERFRCVLNDQAVFDRETGLVWQRQGDASSPMTWAQAMDSCPAATLGGRRAWRLPRIDELQTLDLDVSTGDPFLAIAGTIYWSSTDNQASPGSAYRYSPDDGSHGSGPKTDTLRALCVRGPGGTD